MFDCILIANRGEIACRVIRSCRELAVRSVAVFSDADRGALHTRLADEAVAIGPAPARDSYLRADTLIEAALRSGAQAIHPGYGFLAENAEFARAVTAAGLTFIGPPPEAIEAMGLKDAAKALMQRAGVPVVPGYHGAEQGDARLLAEAKALGFPLLIKAVAGGGGKGMRRVAQLSEFAAALEAARKEAENSFGDSRVLLERYMERPRHIEVQVLADAHGSVLALHERDCSLQRRHQKLVEEAPAPGMSADLRAHISQIAVAAARAVDYRGAGTIEMIADAAHGLSAEHIFFMEMNTRLQVEHPVTEMITGLDLVAWQLRVAAGERLPFAQAELPLRGHAIEVRICAEEPAADYAPRTGQLLRVAWPEPSDHVRIETGVQSGDQVSVFYDSMLAKLVVWDVDRSAAIRRMHRALSQVELLGLAHNVAFLRAAVAQPAFRAGQVYTGFLAEHRAALLAESERDFPMRVVAALVGHVCERAQAAQAQSASPWADTRSFRMNGPSVETVQLVIAEREVEAKLEFRGDELVVTYLEHSTRVREEQLAGARLSFVADGMRVVASYVSRPRAHGFSAFVAHRGACLEVGFGRAHAFDEEAGGADGAIRSPLPGRILSVFVAIGAEVKRGDALISLEAMKMEHTLRASADGVVRELRVAARDQVAEGSTLLVLEARGSAKVTVTKE
jgi:3-methylcrotonyl-CoA carboxylase alpha subunit